MLFTECIVFIAIYILKRWKLESVLKPKETLLSLENILHLKSPCHYSHVCCFLGPKPWTRLILHGLLFFPFPFPSLPQPFYHFLRCESCVESMKGWQYACLWQGLEKTFLPALSTMMQYPDNTIPSLLKAILSPPPILARLLSLDMTSPLKFTLPPPPC